jgi:two-component system, chemotaxis family, protein-glutamate methylesterase/glutaminase
MSKIRVLVVEDSQTVRKRIVEVLSSDPALEVIAEAEDGKRAIELCKAVRPDVITLDMILPVMSGLAVTEYVMAHQPTPILIVSASVNRGELFKTYEALAAGAVETLDKPTGLEPDGEWEQKLISTVKLVSRIKVITHPRGRLASFKRRAGATSLVHRGYDVVAIGASTGGPAAVVDILRAIPESYPLAVLVVIHIGESFASAFAEWLDGQSRLRVAYPFDGEPLADAKGRVILAPPGRHLVVRGGKLLLTSDGERHSCRPSVDVLFESIARELGANAVACLLTGMGRDGAQGLLQIRRAGGLTIAQDEATSVVYGMPREAAMLGAAEQILPLDQIGPALAQLANGPAEPPR